MPSYSEVAGTGAGSYSPIPSPSVQTDTESDKSVMKNYLLRQSSGFLLFQDGSLINIGGSQYTPVPVIDWIEYLLQEMGDFLLLEDGGKIKSKDDSLNKINKPSGSYTEINKPI